MTPLDDAQRRMQAAPDDDRARIAYWHVLAVSELFLLLEGEPGDTAVRPRIVETSDGPLVLAFDAPERMAALAGDGTFHLALTGRDLAGMLAGRGLALGINLGLGVSDFLAPPDALDWLATADLPGVDPVAES
jgi:hypothetical protein